MEITLESTYGSKAFKGTNERGQTLQFSGNQEAVSPMESVLMAAAACSSIDIENLLAKMRQPLAKIEVNVKGHRVDTVPAVFDKMHIHYKIYGGVKLEKAEKAVTMSIEKYCSVSIMLQAAVEITHSFEVVDLVGQ